MGHPFAARANRVYDITFENVQAGLRTDYLFRLANQHDAIVLGTGDLSELALGWCTYGVGDQMSHYNVNAGRAEDADPASDPLGRAFRPVRAGGRRRRWRRSWPPRSRPNWCRPRKAPHRRAPRPRSALTRCRTSTCSTRCAMASARPRSPSWRCTPGRTPTAGAWPPHFPDDRRRAFTLAEIRHWLEVFLRRFFAFSQFKRSAMPNGPKVSAGGALSPRGDWRAPSDGNAAVLAGGTGAQRAGRVTPGRHVRAVRP